MTIFNGLTEPEKPSNGVVVDHHGKLVNADAAESAVELGFSYEDAILAEVRAWRGDRDESAVPIIAGRVRLLAVRQYNGEEWFPVKMVEQTIETTWYDIYETEYAINDDGTLGEVVSEKFLRKEKEEVVIAEREFTVMEHRDPIWLQIEHLKGAEKRMLNAKRIYCHPDCHVLQKRKNKRNIHVDDCRIGKAIRGKMKTWLRRLGGVDKDSFFGYCGKGKGCKCSGCAEGRRLWGMLCTMVHAACEQVWYGTTDQHIITMESRRQALQDKYQGAVSEKLPGYKKSKVTLAHVEALRLNKLYEERRMMKLLNQLKGERK